MFRFVILPCFDLCRSNSSHVATRPNLEGLVPPGAVVVVEYERLELRDGRGTNTQDDGFLGEGVRSESVRSEGVRSEGVRNEGV